MAKRLPHHLEMASGNTFPGDVSISMRCPALFRGPDDWTGRGQGGYRRVMHKRWSTTMKYGMVVAAGVALALTVPAIAQDVIKPPAVEAPGKGSAILSYLIAALLGLVAVGLCALPSRRTHQD